MTSDSRKPSAPTIIDVARESGVSYSTVSRALSGYEYVKPSTREKVLKAAEKLGYVPNQQARSLAGGRSNLVGVLVPTLSNGYISEIVRGVDEELAKSSYNVILYSTHRREGKESAYVASIMNGAADGVVLVVPMLSTTYLEALRAADFPYVLIDQSDQTETSPMVNSTNWQGAYDATKYLIELGHRKIAFITGRHELYSGAERMAGFKQALADHDIAANPDYIVESDFLEAGGYAAAQKLMALQTVPTAVFAANDLSALGAIEAFRDGGLHIPNDISLVGFDDIPQASLVYPKLTTIRQELSQMGRVAVRMLLEHIEAPDKQIEQVTLETQLVIRDSCRPPRQE